MEKRTTITIPTSDLKNFLLEKGFITERDFVSEIHLIANNEGILIEIIHLDLTKKQKEFMDIFVKDMDLTIRLISAINRSWYGTSTVKQTKMFEYLRGSDLFNLRKEKDWLMINNSDKKIVEELNVLFKQYDLPPLEKK